MLACWGPYVLMCVYACFENVKIVSPKLRMVREHVFSPLSTHVLLIVAVAVAVSVAESVWITLLSTGASCAGQDKPDLQRSALLLRERVLPRWRLAFPDRTEICGAVRQEDPMNKKLNMISIHHSTCQMLFILVLQKQFRNSLIQVKK